ncbi:MAG: FeoA family protein [Desulfovibrio sp.]|nr:FeoA family protein [Desulfovibrio sp.]
MIHASFADAPCGKPLRVERIVEPLLEERLARMGIFPASEVTRLDGDADLHAVRVRSARGEVVLGGGMGGKVVAHLDDGRMLPLTDLKPGERGHVETVNGGTELTEALAALGLESDEEIELVRRLPSMEYVTLVLGRGRVRLSEGMAAKILGRMGDLECQFANARAGVDFQVERIIGGQRARRAIASLGVHPGEALRLLAVEKAPHYRLAAGERFILCSAEGLRLFLRPEQAGQVIVGFAGTKERDNEERA